MKSTDGAARAETKLAWLCRVVTEEDKVNLRHALQRRGETDVWANRNHGYTA
ncbi:MAG: hypothetical protein SPF16_07460 [Prevotella sp.]|nr:hypothetical protein [Prevotella sp.]